MMSIERVLFISTLAAALFAPACTTVSVPDWPYVLAAADAGSTDDGAASDGASDDAADGGSPGGGQSTSSPDPLACDGALCDTTNYTACSIANSPREARGAWRTSVLLVVAGLAFARSRTRRRNGARGTRGPRRLTGAAAFLAVVVSSRAIFAEAPVSQIPASVTSNEASPEAGWSFTPTAAVDVALPEPAPPRRILALEWNPLAAAALHRYSANIIFAPFEHHALILSPFHAYARTYAINLYDDDGNPLLLPVQRFFGWGAELGYRYYAGRGGLRGLFLGPSLIADWMTAYAQNGSQTNYIYYGVAADVGYQVLVTDRVSLSLGAGLQYARPNKDIPKQGFQAKYYANSIVLPRWLISIGWAL